MYKGVHWKSFYWVWERQWGQRNSLTLLITDIWTKLQMSPLSTIVTFSPFYKNNWMTFSNFFGWNALQTQHLSSSDSLMSSLLHVEMSSFENNSMGPPVLFKPEVLGCDSSIITVLLVLLYPRHTKYVGVYSFHFFIRPFICMFVRLSVTVKVFALKFIRPHILKTLWFHSYLAWW